MKMQSHPDLGNIPTHWEVAELGDVADVTKLAGYEFTKHIKYIEDGEIIALRSLNVVDGQLDLSNVKRIARTVSEELPRSKLFQNDLLLTYTGSKLGDTALIDNNDTYHLAPNVCRLRANEDDDAYFLYVYLRSKVFANLLDSFKVGSGQPTVPMKNIRKIPLPWPPKEERKKIGLIFSGLTEKIELNTQTNQTLEQIAQALFKSWFVDFDPVKAKIETLATGGSADDAELAAMRVISTKTLDELNSLNASNPEAFRKLAEAASLFPEKLVESELGLIPEGWKVGTLDSHTSMIIDHRGKTPKKLGSDWVEKGYPAISAKNIKSKKIVRPDTIRFIDEATYKKWMKEPLIKGDIIMTSEAPMGELYFFDGSEDFCLSQRLYGLRANSDVCSPEYLFNWLQTTKAKADMEGRASGTTALGIKQAELRKVKILTPPLELLEKYSAVASNLVDMAAKNNAQNTVLEDLRDTLLPKLLSGEIDLTSEVIA
ncbi:putative type-1 restriction enzyme HindVIIP specificity protein [Pseudoalteromonas sp. NCCP-2140]|uniref:restriction endonuclease subunit S n=1 Tax=Pseudoalteromonas sp. NCCP-2140 TaxID=2942288 RepID=UPI00203B71D0|nr:restriction endonuclease subunit S [Pseudoalteromonas sp. NCCP-2140]GKW54738.1 putative type-1 restriction enzyme HindVIIP specificity protein [Pseudoalteromonas sp. NCCP-2140]